MGCGCQDKESDEKIIAYYNEKKKQMEGEYYRTWNGQLCHFSLFMIEEKDIVSIRKIGEDMWEAKCIKVGEQNIEIQTPIII